MCMIVYGHEHSKYSRYLDQLFRLRLQIFVRELGWSLPTCRGWEIDQYDTDDAVYFISLGEDSCIEASVRMTPTVHSSLLADYFPHLIETGEPARSPRIYEGTRFIVRPKIRTRIALRRAKVKLFAPVLEWCLEQRLTHFQTVTDVSTLNSFVEVTPHTRILGLPYPFGGGRGAPGGGECVALRWPVTTEVLDHIRAYGEVAAPRKNSIRGQATFTVH